MKYFRDANLYRAVITVDNLVPRVFCLFGQLKPKDSGYGSTKIRNPESGNGITEMKAEMEKETESVKEVSKRSI